MSKKLSTIEGVKEYFDLTLPAIGNEIVYEPQELRLVRFHGKEHEGLKIQLSIENKHIQLNKEQINKLKIILDRYEVL